MHDPVEIKVQRGHAHDRHRRPVLRRGAGPREARGARRACSKEERPEQAIVFARTKIGVDRLARRLGDAGVRVKALHGDMSQGQRDGVMIAFKGGRERLLVATDVAARGLDITGVSHVVNYDIAELPRRLRAPHRPHRPRRRERPRDHPDHPQAAPRARGDRAPRQDRDRAVGAERASGAERKPRAQAARARDAPAAAHQAAPARRRALREAHRRRGPPATASSRPTWSARSSTTRHLENDDVRNVRCSSASASSRCPPSAPAQVAESGLRERGPGQSSSGWRWQRR